VFPWGISIRVETCGIGRKQKCGPKETVELAPIA
jgi:hypothetical protein